MYFSIFKPNQNVITYIPISTERQVIIPFWYVLSQLSANTFVSTRAINTTILTETNIAQAFRILFYFKMILWFRAFHVLLLFESEGGEHEEDEKIDVELEEVADEVELVVVGEEGDGDDGWDWEDVEEYESYLEFYFFELLEEFDEAVDVEDEDECLEREEDDLSVWRGEYLMQDRP